MNVPSVRLSLRILSFFGKKIRGGGPPSFYRFSGAAVLPIFQVFAMLRYESNYACRFIKCAFLWESNLFFEKKVWGDHPLFYLFSRAAVPPLFEFFPISDLNQISHALSFSAASFEIPIFLWKKIVKGDHPPFYRFSALPFSIIWF